MSPPIKIDRTAGHIGYLTTQQVNSLKEIWSRLFTLFEQEGIESDRISSSKKSTSSSSSWFSKKEAKEPKELFVGTTTNPEWLSLPLEKALPLIPGDLLEQTFWNMVTVDNPDAVCLRFLRARKWDLEAAFQMLVNTLRWRLVMRVDDIIALGEIGLRDELNRLQAGLGDLFITNLNSGKAYLGGPDKEGRGICFINVKGHNKDAQPLEIIKLLTMYIMETSRVIVHQPVEACCIVFNMDGFTLKNMDFDFVKFLLGCFEAYYPETLGSCLIHKAPWVFSTVWGLIQPLLDPVVATKIHFTKDFNDVEKFVERSALPSNITGETDKKTLDEHQHDQPISPGKLERPTTQAYLDYLTAIDTYKAATANWINEKTAENENGSERRTLARAYRHARIKTEKDLRGPSSYEAKGLMTLTPDHRAILNFGSAGWVPLDITDMV